MTNKPDQLTLEECVKLAEQVPINRWEEKNGGYRYSSRWNYDSYNTLVEVDLVDLQYRIFVSFENNVLGVYRNGNEQNLAYGVLKRTFENIQSGYRKLKTDLSKEETIKGIKHARAIIGRSGK